MTRLVQRTFYRESEWYRELCRALMELYPSCTDSSLVEVP